MYIILNTYKTGTGTGVSAPGGEEKGMGKKSKMYLQMFLSYLGILVIPMILAMALYLYTLKIISGQAEEMNGNLLVMVKNELDYEIENIRKIASRLALDDRVLLAGNVRGEFASEDQMNLYYIFNECQSIHMSEEFVDELFLVFNHTGKIISSSGNMSDYLFYDLYLKSSGFPFKQFQEYMQQFHYGDLLPVRLDSGEQIFLYTMSALKSGPGDSSAVICVQIDAGVIRERLKKMKWSDSMDIMMLTDTHVRVGADEGISGGFEWKYEQWETGNHQLALGPGEKYIISVLPSSMGRWKYLSVMPVRQMEREARKVRAVAIAGLFFCTVVGVFISYHITRRNYNPVKMLMDTFRQHGPMEIGEGENEYQWLNRQMDDFFKRHVDAQKLLKKNQKSLKNYYLYQLLQDAGDKKSVEQYGLTIQGDYNVVLLLTPIMRDGERKEGEGYIEENALQKFALMNVFEEMCLDYFHINMVELGERVAAIVSLPDDRREHLDVLKNQAENLQQMMEESFGFSVVVLVGAVCTGWEGIHASYVQAVKMEQYVHLLDADLLFYDEIKDIQPQYHYPLELEEKIINAVKAGDSIQAWATIEQVFDLNLKGRVAASLYCCLIYGIMGTVLEGARQGGYADAAREAAFFDGDISEMPVGKMKRRFKEMLEEICQRILDIQRENVKDQTLSKKIQAYIQENYQDPDLNISITSQHFDLTPAYLSSIYKKQMKGSLLEYINTVRITHAKEFLEQGYSVVEVAEMAGFRDSGTFIRAFKKKMGITPGQLKRKNQEI